VFLPDARAVGRRKRQFCAARGLTALFPLDTEIEDTEGSPQALAGAIYRANCALMDRCDAGIANLTPFRGPSVDAGTAFEIGYLVASGRPVFGYSGDPRLYADRVPVAADSLGPTGLRDDDGFDVESFGLHDNLMIDCAIAASGGAVVVAASSSEAAPLAAVTAFERAVEICAAALLGRKDA